MLRLIKTFAVAMTIAILSDGAQAGFVPILTSPTAGGAGSVFTYDLVFSTNGVESLNRGDLITLYDFYAGTLSLTRISVPSGIIVVSLQFLGITPIPSTGTINPVDDPNIPNITFYYEGPTLTTNTTFRVSIFLDNVYSTRVGQYSAQNSTTSPGQTNTQLGSVFLPTLPTTVPEPSSNALLGLGVLGCLVALARNSDRV